MGGALSAIERKARPVHGRTDQAVLGRPFAATRVSNELRATAQDAPARRRVAPNARTCPRGASLRGAGEGRGCVEGHTTQQYDIAVS